MEQGVCEDRFGLQHLHSIRRQTEQVRFAGAGRCQFLGREQANAVESVDARPRRRNPTIAPGEPAMMKRPIEGIAPRGQRRQGPTIAPGEPAMMKRAVEVNAPRGPRRQGPAIPPVEPAMMRRPVEGIEMRPPRPREPAMPSGERPERAVNRSAPRPDREELRINLECTGVARPVSVIEIRPDTFNAGKGPSPGPFHSRETVFVSEERIAFANRYSLVERRPNPASTSYREALL